jgi:hypothetical protein
MHTGGKSSLKISPNYNFLRSSPSYWPNMCDFLTSDIDLCCSYVWRKCMSVLILIWYRYLQYLPILQCTDLQLSSAAVFQNPISLDWSTYVSRNYHSTDSQQEFFATLTWFSTDFKLHVPVHLRDPVVSESHYKYRYGIKIEGPIFLNANTSARLIQAKWKYIKKTKLAVKIRPDAAGIQRSRWYKSPNFYLVAYKNSDSPKGKQ